MTAREPPAGDRPDAADAFPRERQAPAATPSPPAADAFLRERRRRRVWLAVVGVVVVLTGVVGYYVTGTASGRDAALSVIRGAITGSVNGEVLIGPAISGNVVTDLTVSRVEIRDADGELFLALDTVTIAYDPLALLGRQLRIHRLHARGLDLNLTQLTDGSWNADRIFSPPPRAAPPAAAGLARAGAAWAQESGGGGLSVYISEATIASGDIRIRTPWTARLSGSERERALREAEAGESPWALYRTPEGEFDNLYEFSNARARLPQLHIAGPETPLLLELEDLSGTLRAVRQPLELERLSGRLTLRDTADIVIDHFQTDRSALSGTGWMTGSDPVQYRFELDAAALDVRDLRWLPMDLPETGGGPMRIDVYSRDATSVVAVSNGDFRTGDTRLTGGFSLALGERPRFDNLDVTLAPFALHHLDELLLRAPAGAADPATDPVVRVGTGGWALGTIRGAGWVDDLDIDADLVLEGPVTETLPSRLRARGGVAFTPAGDVVEAPGLRGLEVTLDGFDPRWTQLLGIDMGIDGRFGGTLTLDRDAGGAVAFAGAVDHRTPAGDVSRFSGGGRLDLDGAGVDAALEVNPLALSLLRPWTSGVDLAGNVSGPVRARGTREALFLDARLQTDRGGLTLNGEFDLTSEDLRYDTRIEGRDLSLDQWIEGAPDSRLDVRGRVEGVGVDPATLEATFDLDILPSQVDQAQVFDSRVRFRIAEGLAMIDSLFLASDVGTLLARGDFGLAGGATA